MILAKAPCQHCKCDTFQKKGVCQSCNLVASTPLPARDSKIFLTISNQSPSLDTLVAARDIRDVEKRRGCYLRGAGKSRNGIFGRGKS